MPDRRLPIIGYPLSETPLELVLRAAFAALGVELAIERQERKPHLLAAAIDELRVPEVAGILLASPHKEKAATLVDALSDDGRLGGAANLMVHRDERLTGHLTDLEGVRAGLHAILPADENAWPKEAVVLGAGGGARAVVAALIDAGFGHVAVFNRHLHRAEALVTHFRRVSRQMDLRARPWHEAILEVELARAPLVVNASGIGTDADESPIPAELVPEERYVLDLVVDREETPLMRHAAARGGTVANGRASFLAGTAAIVTLLTERPAPLEAMRAGLEAAVGRPAGSGVLGD